MANRNNFKRNFNYQEETQKSISISYQVRSWISERILRVQNIVKDATSDVGTSLKGIVKRIGLSFPTVEGGDFNRDFELPDFDLQQIEDAYETDGYVRQAIDKYVDLIYKTGYEFIGTDPNAVEYIKIRLAYMQEVTGIPTNVFFQEIAENLVKYNNVIIAKARAKDPAGLPPTNAITGLDGIDPIGGYFILPTQTMKVKRDKFGVVKGWEQEIEEQDKTAKFKPTDIIHMYYKREPGKAFAYPALLSVLDDVRALREMEDRVIHMIYRNVNPLIHMQVGTKEAPGQPGEVDEGRLLAENMSVDGGMVTTERVKLDAISTKNTIDAEPYLKHFERRIFTGLGVSETMMGRGDTSNRSTSDNQKEEAVDRVKAFQRIISTYCTTLIINELLREGGYDPLNNPDHRVVLAFKDPDIDSKIKQENHAILKFQANAITEDEMRKDINREPIADGDREKIYFTMYGQKDTIDQTSNISQPENQSGKKTSPKKQTNSVDIINNITEESAEMLRNNYINIYRRRLMMFTDRYYNGNDILKDIENENKYNLSLITKLYENIDSRELYILFEGLFGNIKQSLSDYDTTQVAKETISAYVDIFIEELNYILNTRREDINE